MSKKNFQKFQNNFVLGDLVKTFIGPSRRIKCLEVEGRSRYFRHASLLLEQLDVEHPVYRYVISVSSEFRKLYGERAADDLLFFIDSWSRVITDLISLEQLGEYEQEVFIWTNLNGVSVQGVPMTDVTFYIKDVITACIEHIKTKRFLICEVTTYANKKSINSITASYDNPTTKESMFKSISNDLSSENETVKEDSFNSLHAKERLVADCENKNENKAQKTVIVQHVEEMTDGLKCRSENEEEIKKRDSNDLAEESVEMIHLEMKNITSEIEDDDTSWFFDDDGNTDRILEMVKQGEEVHTEENAIAADDDDVSGDEGNSDDSGAILRDIEKLKRDIKSDLKRIQEKKEQIRQLNMKETTCNELKSIDMFDTNTDEEFDSCFDSSDSEFSDCFEETNVNVFQGNIRKRSVENKCASNTDTGGFKSIQLKFAKIAEKNKEEVSVSKFVEKTPETSELMGVLKCPTSGVDTNLVNRNSSLDIEIQMCQREFSKTQEMLKSYKSHMGNKETERNIEKSKFFKCDENQSLELVSECKHSESVCSKNEEITAGVKTDLQECLETFKSNNFDHWKLRQKPSDEGKIQQINSLLDSVRKGCRSGVGKAGVSSLKFHSRYFQESECEEPCQKRDLSQTVKTKPPDLTKKSDNGIDSNIVQKQKISETCLLLGTESETLSNSSDRHLKSIPKSSRNCMDINDINNILKDIKRISSVPNACMKEDMHSSDLLGNYSETHKINRLHTNEPRRDEQKQVKLQCNMLEPEGKNALKLPSARMSNILLRSRHMNMENELPAKTSLPGAAHLSELEDEENVCQKSKQMQEIVNTDKQLISEKTTETEEMENKLVNTNNFGVLKDDINRLVKGVNYDGDENISKAVTDVILKQSGVGKPRLNLDIVDCYCRECINEPPKVIDGVVVKVSVDTFISLIQKHAGKQYRALLLNGDLTDTFRHKGYKSVNVKKFSTVERLTSGECSSKFDGWLNDVIHTFKELSVNLLLMRGSISEDVLSVCGTLDIVTVDAVPYKQLVQLSEAAQVDMVTYVTLATQENICAGLSISPLQHNWCDSLSEWNCKQEIVISLTGINPQTVVLSGITPMLTDLMEQELWDCLHHVTSVLHCGYWVSGAGRTEEECAIFLNKNLEALRRNQNSARNQDIQYKQLVLEAVISSLNSYVHLFKDSEQMPVCAIEGFTGRIETWKTALDVVITINNIDSFVTTGLTEEEMDTGAL